MKKSVEKIGEKNWQKNQWKESVENGGDFLGDCCERSGDNGNLLGDDGTLLGHGSDLLGTFKPSYTFSSI